MEEPFILKYKPFFIDDFKLNTETETTLKTFLELDELNILIYGITGSGKTMLLEALVREYYGIKKNQAFPEHNILYINPQNQRPPTWTNTASRAPPVCVTHATRHRPDWQSRNARTRVANRGCATSLEMDT